MSQNEKKTVDEINDDEIINDDYDLKHDSNALSGNEDGYSDEGGKVAFDKSNNRISSQQQREPTSERSRQHQTQQHQDQKEISIKEEEEDFVEEVVKSKEKGGAIKIVNSKQDFKLESQRNNSNTNTNSFAHYLNNFNFNFNKKHKQKSATKQQNDLIKLNLKTKKKSKSNYLHNINSTNVSNCVNFSNVNSNNPNLNIDSHELFVELEELQLITPSSNNNLASSSSSSGGDTHSNFSNVSQQQQAPVYEWREISRWIKYEQRIDLETNILSKPFVGPILYQSLLYLKTGLQYGTVLLNSDHESLVDVIDEMIQDFCDSGHMNKENREQVKRTLLSHHRHNQSSLITGGSGSGLQRKKSTISDLFNPSSRRPSTFIHQPPHQSNNEQTTSFSQTDNPIIGNHHSRKQFSEFNLSSKMENLKFPKSSTSSQNLSVSDANLVQQSQPSYRNMSISEKRKNSIKINPPSGSSSHFSSRHNSAIAGNNNEFNSHLNPHSLTNNPNKKANSNTCIIDEDNSSNLNVGTNGGTGGENYYTKRRRSTIALIKNTLNKTSTLNKSETSIKGMSPDAEAFVIMVGVVDYLDRPVMGFVRLLNGLVIGNDTKFTNLLNKSSCSCAPASPTSTLSPSPSGSSSFWKSNNSTKATKCIHHNKTCDNRKSNTSCYFINGNDDFVEVQLKVKFLFILLGPKNDNIDYLEIGRCMGTLMTNKGFHACAYRANDRRDLIEGITNFSNQSLNIVLPLGNFDTDLLTPLIDWIQKKMKKKLRKLCTSLGGGTHSHSHSLSTTNLAHQQLQHSKNASLTNSCAASLQKSKENLKIRVLNGLEYEELKKKSVTTNENQNNETNDNCNEYESDLNEDDESKYSNYDGDGGRGVGVDDENNYDDPFQQTGRAFGCLLRDIKTRYSVYCSDFTDAFNLHCIVALIFTFTVCIAPALSFGGILADKTNKWFGINEMLIAVALNGIISGFFSGQPLMIMGPTGPFLVFEEMIYLFLPVRCWVSMWVLIFTLIMLAYEGVYIIKYVTRFTEEIFAFLIAAVFLADAFKKVIKTFMIDPIHTTEFYCSKLTTSPILGSSSRFGNDTNYTNNQSYSSYLNTDAKDDNCIYYRIENNFDSGDVTLSKTHVPSPNIALLSLILLIGTCVMALALKKLRRSVFFGAYVRRTFSDVGMLISIVLMVTVDYLIESKTGLKTQKLDIPDNSWMPTQHRSWFVSPFGSQLKNFSYWIPLGAIFPALLIFIVLFFEVELTGMILYAKSRRLRKGTGFNLDLLIAALMMNMNSLFGLPWTCAAPVRTLAHWTSLTVYSKTYVPGEKPKLIDVKEQRLTNILVHLIIGLCLFARFALKIIPISVLFGIFLYFGIVSLSGTQLYERIRLIFIPSKYCPNVVYARGVRPSKRNFFTIIQLGFAVVLLAIKSFNQVSYIFPLILVLLVPLRLFLMPKLFTNKELEQLDHPNEMVDDNSNNAMDFYELTHLPI